MFVCKIKYKKILVHEFSLFLSVCKVHFPENSVELKLQTKNFKKHMEKALTLPEKIFKIYIFINCTLATSVMTKNLFFLKLMIIIVNFDKHSPQFSIDFSGCIGFTKLI